MKDYSILNTPFQIGKLTVPNRYVMAPMTMGDFYDENQSYNDMTVNYFALRAKGGFGLIIPGASATDGVVDPFSALGPVITQTPGWKNGAKKLVEAVHEAGSKIFCQISMGLGRNYPGLPAPSEAEVWNSPGVMSPALTKEQIKTKISLMIEGAKIAKECGYDGVEIHAMHWGYLLDQFGMSFFNHRDDEYGGSLENRLRAAREIVEGIKEACGKDFPVSMRLSLETFIKGVNQGTITGEGEVGRTLEEGVEIAKLLEKYGYDVLDVDTGTYDSFYYACPPMYMPQGFMIALAEKAKEAVKIPIVAGGRMQDPDQAKEAVESGKIDGIALGRPSLADADLPNKVYANTPERIRPCLGCNIGCFNRLISEGKPASCAVNPTAARETTMELRPKNGDKKVLVVGGGVGGMEAARVAALRGYEVTLLEKSDRLGGHLIQAGAHSFKKEIAQLNSWYQNELKDLKVKVVLNCEADAETLRKFEADEIILATGSDVSRPRIPGLEKTVDSISAIDDPKQIKDSVIVIGGGLVGCEIAYDCALEGKKVCVVEALDNILSSGVPAPIPNAQMIKDLFEMHNVSVYTGHKVVEIKDGAVVCEHDGKTVTLEAETVISALGFRAHSLKEEAEKAGLKVSEIGDAVQARTIMAAIWDGYDAANAI